MRTALCWVITTTCCITVQKSAVHITEFVCVGRAHIYFNQDKFPIIFVSMTKLKTADTKM